MRRILRIALVMTFSFSLLYLLSVAPSASDEETELPEFCVSLSEGSVRIQSTAGRYLVSGCPEPGMSAALEICNTVRYGAVYHLTLCSESGNTSYFPNITVNGGNAREITLIVHIEGEIVIETLQLSGYKSADIRIATSGGGKLNLHSIQTADDARKTAFSVSENTVITPEIPEQESVIPSGYTSDAPAVFALAFKETEICTIEFIVAGMPDQHMILKVEKGGLLTDIPNAEDDEARVFLGWSQIPDENMPPDFSLPIENSMILYAYFHYHNFSAYSYDADMHWKVCECGQISPDGKMPHDFCADETPECLVSVADCIHSAVYRYSCACGFHSDKTFEGVNSPAKGHIEKTKGNEIVCADCGIHIRDIQPIGDEVNHSDENDRNTDPPITPDDDGPKDPLSDSGSGKGSGADDPLRSDSHNTTGDESASSVHELPPVAAFSIIAGLLLAAVVTVVVAVRRHG